MIIIAFLIQVSRSAEECLISECGQALEICSSSDICSEALSQVYDVCAQVQDCTDQQYVNTEICGLNHECTQQIVKIASCFIDNCSDEDSEQQIVDDAEELIGQEGNQQEEECFHNSCTSEVELCVANEGCNYVLNHAHELCSGDDYKCLNQHYVENIACDGFVGCSDLVLATAKCFYQNCNDECININCHQDLTNCVNSENCNQGLQLAYSGYCQQINCLDHDAQLNILCNGDVTAADYFNVLANCYYDNCFNEEIEEEHNDYKGYGSAECIAESGYHGFFDEYGNCCAGLDRIDCLWNKQDSHCGWFYDNETQYCYGWQGADTCASFKQNSIMASPMSCNFEDCFMDSCYSIISECKDNEDCAIALNKYIYENANDYTLCGNSEECIQIFDQIMYCLNDNCGENNGNQGQQEQNEPDDDEEEEEEEEESNPTTEETNNTQEPNDEILNTENTEEPELEEPEVEENKVLIEDKAIN